MATIFTRTLAAFKAEMDLYFAHLGEKPYIRQTVGEGWLANAPFWDFNAKLLHHQEKVDLLAGLFESDISPDERGRLNKVLDSRKGQIRNDIWSAQRLGKLQK